MPSQPNYKMQAAIEALKHIKGNIIGLGAGTSIAYLVNLIAENSLLVASLTFTSSSFKTTNLLIEKGLRVQPPAYYSSIDVYFDGCDQFDAELNALKSGGGIHTSEKVLASMSTEFILIGDEEKSVKQFDLKYPVVIEILPQALKSVTAKLSQQYPDATLSLRNSKEKDGAVISDNGNYLLDMYFTKMPDWANVNSFIKMLTGVVEDSLFYGLATKAIVAGGEGIKIIENYKDSK